MLKRLLFLVFILSLSQQISAQNEFITLWKPNNSLQSPLTSPQFSSPPTENQIWFPGIGENYMISWEEVGYPQHNGNMPDVTSSAPILIDFGPSLNPNPAEATYMLKVSNGNGMFRQIQFSDDTINTNPVFEIPTLKALGSANKITEIVQWGNIQWTSMKSAFSQCGILDITATDVPDLSKVKDATLMFYNAYSLKGNASIANWDTSAIKKFKYMFGYSTPMSFQFADHFNPPIGSWDMSSAEDISYMFMKRKAFNQNLNSWNTSNVVTMAYTFAECTLFNQPLDNWNTSKVKSMAYMFHFIPNFNQPLNTWDTSNVTDMGHMFHIVSSFNQPLDSWDVSKVTEMNTMFSEATSFNNTLKDWNLNSLISAFAMLKNTGMDCGNYSTTLHGWGNNPNTPNGINLGSVAPSFYSTHVEVVEARDILLNTKNWSFTGDSPVECPRLGTLERSLHHQPSVYPNPVDDIIQLKNLSNAKSYLIFDAGSRLIQKGEISGTWINVQSLAKGNYMLRIITKGAPYLFKFIKQ
ncbi:BspA family leucine-rich repeat surface protein [Chryseobacterium sp.]|uniref:BspA family leucine-rich repeat surface protein n=1 Tax=Chryseobacterium sp. TaxID=1871047 RepID=UPI0033415FA6